MPAGASISTTVQLCSAAQGRSKLVITIDSGVGYVTDSASAPGGVGEVVTPSAPLVYTRVEDGDMVDHAFYGSSSTNTAKFGVRVIMGGTP